MYKIKIKKDLTSKLLKNERLENNKIYKYFKSQSKAIDYCYKNKYTSYLKISDDNTIKVINLKNTNNDITYIIYNVIIENNTFKDLKYIDEFYTLEEIKEANYTKHNTLKDYIITSIEELEDKIINNNLHLLNDRFIIFKEIDQ